MISRKQTCLRLINSNEQCNPTFLLHYHKSAAVVSRKKIFTFFAFCVTFSIIHWYFFADQSSARARSLLSHQPFLKPLLELLNECCRGEIMCNDSETHLVMLLNQLCSRLQDNPALLEVFFKPDDNENKFIIFSILLRFLHFEGKGKLLSKVKLSVVTLNTFVFSRQKLDTELLESGTFQSIPNLKRWIFNNFKRAKLHF